MYERCGNTIVLIFRVQIIGDKLDYRCWPPPSINSTTCILNRTKCATLWPPAVNYTVPAKFPARTPFTEFLQKERSLGRYHSYSKAGPSLW